MNPSFLLSCGESNDIFQLLNRSGVPVLRVPDPEAAVRRALRDQCPVLVLTDENIRMGMSASLLDELTSSGVRAFLEYPAAVPGLTLAPPGETDRLLRGVVLSEEMGLPEESLLTLPGANVSGCTGGVPLLAMGRVAGFDSLAFALGETETWPILVEVTPSLRVATTRLSHFETARFAPVKSWQMIWSRLLSWLGGGQTFSLTFKPRVQTRYTSTASVPTGAMCEALRNGVEWIRSTHLLVPGGIEHLYAGVNGDVAPIPKHWPVGDGSQGLLEGYTSGIDQRGEQKVRWWRRADCNGEAAGAFAVAGAVLQNAEWSQTGARLLEWLYETAHFSNGERANPENPGYGLIGWHDRPAYGEYINGWEVYYGDDNARVILGSLSVAALLKRDDWNRRILAAVLGNFRTTRATGFRRNHLAQEKLRATGWQAHFHNTEKDEQLYYPHYQAYLWACYLWVYEQTSDAMLYERSRAAIETMMNCYPGGWRWTYGIQPERARMLLPLAWLVRVNDTPQHREWLRRIAVDLLTHQQPCGAIREEILAAGGLYAPPASHGEYGKNEASLLQQNGDPVADQLYTTNFAFLGLHEAAAATGDPFYAEAADRLADYFVHTQSASETPELNGAWFRAFDFNRWEYWGSDSDGGWGAWCVEVGWTQAWIIQVLGFRALGTSLWDLAGQVDIAPLYEELHEAFFGDQAKSSSKEREAELAGR